MEGWQPPRDDINAPDLYIPSKSTELYTSSVNPDNQLWLSSLIRSYAVSHPASRASSTPRFSEHPFSAQ